MLYDSLGNPIRLTRPKRPKRVKAKPRVPSNATETARRNLAPVTHVRLTLAARHNLSDNIYGPGEVVVPFDVAKVLQENERRAAWSDRNFTSTRACVIGPGRQKGGLGITEVSPEYFEMQYGNSMPFGVVDRNSGQFSPVQITNGRYFT